MNWIPKGKINEFPLPYREEAVVQKQTSFSAETRDAIASGKVTKPRPFWAYGFGEAKVGKTALISRYCQNVFETNYKPTIYTGFQTVYYSILGQPCFMNIFDGFRLDDNEVADAYLVIFDLSDIKSLESTRLLLNKIRKYTKDPGDVFLVGTKKDRCKPAELKEIETFAVKYAKEFGAEYWSVSSKTGENVNWLFERITALKFDKEVKRLASDEPIDISTPDVSNTDPLQILEAVKIAQRIPGEWAQVALLTGQFEIHEIENIRRSRADEDASSKALTMLQQYIERQGQRRTLANALRELGNNELADKVLTGYFNHAD